MGIPLYILGLIRRFGPQHGYQIKKIITEEIADFARIKLPTIYYHLQRMETDGILVAENEKSSNRPERRVYRITPSGDVVFKEDLAKLLSINYEPSFDYDALFYFADAMEAAKTTKALEAHAEAMQAAYRALENHEARARANMSVEVGAWASIIFSHHRLHYEAEVSWALEAIETLRVHVPVQKKKKTGFPKADKGL